MRKITRILILAASLLCAAPALRAVPADPTPFRYVQPDGTVLTLQMHGDEWFGWTTDKAGTVVTLGADGFYRAVPNPGAWLAARQAEGMRMRAMAERLRAEALAAHAAGGRSPMTEGTRHIPVILLEFSDLHFTIANPAQAFDDMLNKEGYSANGAIGSVNDFYRDNSHGKFDPVFDVFGPVNIGQPHAQYGDDRGSAAAAKAFNTAIGMLDSQIDFNNYDYDKDGYVDMILFYYAGHNAAEGAGGDTIWPHQWWFSYAGVNQSYDGKRLGRYFCTSELKGSSGSNMCGIGTTCHEFGHSLGLPDFYDTDYGTNGSSGALYTFSTMCSGSYNSGGTKPPFFNVMERSLLDWCDEPKEISRSGDYTLRSVRIDNEAFSIPTTTDGEIMILECRDQNKWDSSIPSGLLIYHLDRSRKSGRIAGTTPYNLWYNSNSINAYGSHPCFYLIPAATLTSRYQNQFNSQALKYGGSANAIIFPGTQNKTQFFPVDWENENTGYFLSEIRYSGGQVSFHVQTDNNCIVSGTVGNEAGSPVYNATVRIGSFEYTTGRDGRYQITIDDDYIGRSLSIQVSCSGYRTVSESFIPTAGTFTKNFTLTADPGKTIGAFGYNVFGGFTVGQTFRAGDVIPLTVREADAAARKPKSAEWYLDGKLVTAPSVTLTAGRHTLAMHLTYGDGSFEIVEYDIEAL